MVLYNVTVGIDRDAEQEWLKWMRDEHIPKVLATNAFIEHKIFKVLNQEEEESVSYSIQYFAERLDHVVDYLNNHAPRLAGEHQERYKNRHVAFRTLLEQI